jgi:hypothetical protein
VLAGASRAHLPSTSPDPSTSEEVQERKNAARERRGEL